MSTSSLDFLRKIFLPTDNSAPTQPVSFLEHAGEWTDGARGSADCLSLLARIAEWAKLFGPQSQASLQENFQVKCDEFKAMSIIPQVFSDLGRFFCSLRNWRALGDNVDSLSVAKSLKRVIMDGLSLVATLAQTELLAENFKVPSLSTRRIHQLNVISNASLLLVDGADFIGNCLELCQGDDLKKKRLAWLNFTTNGTSVALSFMTLGDLFSSSFRPWIARATLPLSTVYLVAKLSSHFYKKMKVEQPSQN